MSPIAVGFIGMLFVLVLLLSRMHIGLAMGLVGFLGFGYIAGWDPALGLLRTVPYTTFANEGMSVIPLFILMGAFAFEAGMSEDLYRAVHKIFGGLRGGLAMATVAACACFAAISGSSLATAATLGRVAMPEMKKYRYDLGLATGSIAAGGCIGILIPPSVILIIYGILTEQSIGKLFMAGVIPGILEALFYIITIWLLTRKNPHMGPPGPRANTREKLKAFTKTWEVLVLFTLVIGGLYMGIFTPTEAAGIGAFCAFCFAVLRGSMKWENIANSLTSTASTTGMLFLIVAGAMILGYFFAITRLPFEFASMVAALPVNRYVILACIVVVVLILGCLMDSLAIVLLTVPVFYPLILELNFDPIWFGIIVVRVTEMGLITPPVGLNVFVLHGITGTPMQTIFKGVLPFLVADVIELILLISIPQLSLFLPNLMSG
ncbi:TRAP transporter large permease [Desulforhopalus singaporensis]|uniref:TRAP transporter, DctM subunit n=1 Tax=Desulforhopalus singaporensis TaxID=91360 RepID=A0A1H0ITJ9_9BACT|nr:TRAP transporter large permease [Desulforhopalus singaporensis]SDO34768.1 TRAP transporter, DctM subunit [Desulforhopalus singaporensis]